MARTAAPGRAAGFGATLAAVLLAAAGWHLIEGRDRGVSTAVGAQAHTPVGVETSRPPQRLGSVSGSWEFGSITGVPPSSLPSGALRDNRHDLVISDRGVFRWGGWAGRVEASDGSITLLVERPERLRRRFEWWNAGIGVDVDGNELRIWLPDLGRDRDEDRGEAQEDIDSPDMVFRRAAPRERLDTLAAAWHSPVTIAYSSTEHVAGEATSPHQCLRQVFGGTVDVQEALRMCLREERVRLTWGPPDGWRMATSSSDGELALLVARPSTVRREIGGGRRVTRLPDRTIAGRAAECFSAQGTARRSVAWCFSDDGLPLQLLVRDGDGTTTTLTAIPRTIPGR